jgi:hypothetical protein
MTEQTTFTAIEAINEFYRLKDKYQTGYYEKYVKPIITSNKSKREKRVEYSKLPKHECINCKRNVETLFNISVKDREQQKFFKARCGDIQDPCPLDIEIMYSNRRPIDIEIREGLSQIEKIKLNIIKEKNNALFFNKNVTDIFHNLTEELKFETEHIGFAIETSILRNDNPEKVVLLKQTIDEFGKGFILPFKQMVREFDETNNELILNQAVTFYITEMIPKLKEIQLLRYDINMVEFDETDNMYKLIQFPNSLEKNEFFYDIEDKVVKFVRGVRKEKKKTRKDDSELRGKHKTRKIKPVAELVLEEEEEEDEEIIEPREGEEMVKQTESKYGEPKNIKPFFEREEMVKQMESKYGEPKNIKPIFEESGNVKWNNEEYDKVWKYMPYKVKDILMEDHDWLEDYMNTCIKLRKENKECNLFLPKQTQFPPVLGEDGEYDFGSKIVNILFNRLNKSYQDILLRQYSVKDGVKSYNMLKDRLTSILAKEVGFERGYF